MAKIKTATVLALVAAISLAFFAIAANAASTNEAVCKINAGSSMGSGTMIGTSADGKTSLVISCYHVVEENQFVSCTFKNVPSLANTKFPGRVVKRSSKWDLAAILIYNPGIAPVEIGDFTVKHPGIYSACGYGAGKYSAACGPVLDYDQAAIETRVNIYGGHSGGCLFDPWGRWCGVTNWSSNSRGPTGRGFTRSRTGVPLEQFTTEAVEQCGILSRLRSRNTSDGGGGCPPGVDCPNPNVPSLPGQGYAPGFQPLTPLASQPGAVAPQTPAAPPVTTVTVTPTITQPAPVADEPKADDNPFATIAKQLDAVYRQEREQAAAAAAMAAYRAAMEGTMTPTPQRLPAKAESQERQPSNLVADLPVVTMQVEYREADGRTRVESATLDLANFVRQQFGLVGEEK